MNNIPDVEIIGTVYKMTFQTDRNGAVLVAHTRAEDGTLGRSWIRLDHAAVEYVRQRIDKSQSPPTIP